jgi:hypothetical protein
VCFIGAIFTFGHLAPMPYAAQPVPNKKLFIYACDKRCEFDYAVVWVREIFHLPSLQHAMLFANVSPHTLWKA